MSNAESPKSERNYAVSLLSILRIILPALMLTIGTVSAAPATASDDDVQTAWRLLDYVAVDYRGAVAGGQIKSAQEYAEMTEFSGAVEAKITTLPASANRAALIAEAKAFRAMVAGKAAPDDVAKAARALGTHLLAA